MICPRAEGMGPVSFDSPWSLGLVSLSLSLHVLLLASVYDLSTLQNILGETKTWTFKTACRPSMSKHHTVTEHTKTLQNTNMSQRHSTTSPSSLCRPDTDILYSQIYHTIIMVSARQLMCPGQARFHHTSWAPWLHHASSIHQCNALCHELIIILHQIQASISGTCNIPHEGVTALTWEGW